MSARAAAWLSLVPLFATGSLQGAEPSSLAREARKVLEQHCYKCHGEDGNAKGGLNYVLDRDKLVARGKVKGGNPGESPLYMRISKGEMPPAKVEKRPTPQELAILQRWIEAGAPAFEQVPRRNFISEIDIVHYIDDDLRRQPARHRRYLRYLTFANLANAGVPEKELDQHRQAMNKLVNSLSWHPRITLPVAIDPARTIYRLDMRDYLWTERTWTRILGLYPHYLPQKGSAMKWVAGVTRTELPYIRGDWFVANVSRPPLYQDTLELPLTDKDLERLLRVDAVQGIREERVMRAGFNGSGIARNNRILERHDSAYGAYWRSYDFSSNLDEQNIFERPLGPVGPNLGTNNFVQAGGEMIFHLPNGLQGYFIVDANGRRLDRAPVEIVSDPKRPDKAVETGISCMSCHVRGLHPKADQIRAHVEKNPNAFTKEDLDIVKAIYPAEKKFHERMNEDIDRFLKALEKTGAKVEPEPTLALTLKYEGELDLPLAAAEFGFTPDDLRHRLEKSPALARVLGPLNVKSGTVQREAFLKILPDALREFGLGDGLRFYPLADVTDPPAADPGFRPFVGHKGHILAVVLSPDGKRALTASEDHTARLWDLETGREIRPFAGHTDEVLAVAFSPDGKRVLTGSADRTARLWDPASGRELRRFEAHTERVSAVAFSPDGKRA
ncbi:MAG: c-type cytochrome domain-containing protein, partial [Gemmataceae bacterium]